MLKLKKIIIIASTLILLLIIFSCIIFYPLFQVENNIITLIDKGYTITSNGQEVRFTSENDTFKDYSNDFYEDYKFIITDYNPLKPTVTFVATYQRRNNLDLVVYKLNRTSLFDYEIENRYTGYIQNKSFQEAKDLAKKYDFSKENPDEENIIVFDPPTREEVERQQTRIKKEKANAENEALQAALQACEITYAKEKAPYADDRGNIRRDLNLEDQEKMYAIFESFRNCEKAANASNGALK